MTRTSAALTCLSIGLGLLAACESKQSPKATSNSKENLVCTTFYPTTYFAERIAGGKIEVVNPCPADVDPAFWMPDEETMREYQGADLIVVNGASFEKWVDKVGLAPSRMVDTTKPLADELIVIAGAVTHTHGPTGEHSHEGVDGHTWLDPINAKTQAEQIKLAMVKSFPDHKETFEAGYADLAKALDALDARHKVLAEKLKDRFMLCSHPAYNYVGRRYGWKLKSFHLDPGEMPEDATFAEIKEFLAGQPSGHMLWESAPTDEIATRFRDELGLKSIVFSPCEALDAEALKNGADFLTVMNGNIDRMEQALGE